MDAGKQLKHTTPIEELRGLLREVGDRLLRAGQLYAREVDKDRVRSPSEQAAWHEEQAAKRRKEVLETYERKLADGTTPISLLGPSAR